MNAKLCPGDLNEIQWQLLSLGSLSCFRSAWGFPIWSAAPCHMENLPPRPFWLPWSRQKPWKMPWNWAQHGPTISRKTIWKYHMSILRESNEYVCIQQSNESNALGSPTALMQPSSVKWASEMLSSFSRSQLRAASARDWYSSWDNDNWQPYSSKETQNRELAPDLELWAIQPVSRGDFSSHINDFGMIWDPFQYLSTFQSSLHTLHLNLQSGASRISDSAHEAWPRSRRSCTDVTLPVRGRCPTPSNPTSSDNSAPAAYMWQSNSPPSQIVSKVLQVEKEKPCTVHQEIQRMAYIMNSNISSRIFEDSSNQEPSRTFCMPSEAAR